MMKFLMITFLALGLWATRGLAYPVSCGDQYINGQIDYYPSNGVPSPLAVCTVWTYVPVAKNCINDLGQECVITWTEEYAHLYGPAGGGDPNNPGVLCGGMVEDILQTTTNLVEGCN